MSGFLLGVKGLGSFSEKMRYYMWGEISKVPLPDFEPREESPRGVHLWNPPRGNPLKETLRGKS